MKKRTRECSTVPCKNGMPMEELAFRFSKVESCINVLLPSTKEGNLGRDTENVG
jgi:hypothetical protein